MPLTFKPLVPELWNDFTRLFGQRGACGGCWCMYWRQTQKSYDQNKGTKNRQAMKKIIQDGHVPGIIAYDGSEPVAWCSVAQRTHYSRLQRSRTLKPIDNQPVWSVVCFYVSKPYRHQGISVKMLQAAIAYVADQGGLIVEGYPYEPQEGKKWPDAFVWTGTAAAYRAAGFVEVARPSATRPIMRYEIDN